VGNDVYVAGEEGDFTSNVKNIAKYWKHGQDILLTGAIGAGATSIAIDGSDVYVAGEERVVSARGKAAYWRNGQSIIPISGPDRSVATGIVAD
jgi:hypothetical protein